MFFNSTKIFLLSFVLLVFGIFISVLLFLKITSYSNLLVNTSSSSLDLKTDSLFILFLGILVSFVIFFINIVFVHSRFKLVSNSKLIESDLEKFQMAVKDSNDQIVISDSEGKVIYANPAIERITGFTPKEAVGSKAGVLWGKKMDSKFYERMWKTIKIDKKPFTGEITNKRKNGVEYIAQVSISPMINSKQDAEYFVSIERDITKAKEVDRMKTEFISLTSHQLRTPLSGMKWFLEMLINGDAGSLNDKQNQFVTTINESNERMIALVNSLLNISRIESGRLTIDIKAVELKQVINNIFDNLKEKINAKNIKVTLNIPNTIPNINTDPKLIGEAYSNLLSNAIKYSNLGGDIELNISEDKDNILSKISDNGIGISKNNQERIFQRFYRADNAIKHDPDGNGLGLYLVKAIIESCGGKIWFESEENKGTTFYFTLPKKGVEGKKGEVTLS